MKIVRYKDETGVKLGAVKGDGVIDLNPPIPFSLRQSNRANPTVERSLSLELEKIVSDSAAGCSFGKRAAARPGSATRQDHGDRPQLRGPHQRDRSKDAASSNLVHQGGDLDQRTV